MHNIASDLDKTDSTNDNLKEESSSEKVLPCEAHSLGGAFACGIMGSVDTGNDH